MISAPAQAIGDAAEELAQLESLDTGRPLHEHQLVDIPGPVQMLEYMAGWASKINGEAFINERERMATSFMEHNAIVQAIVRKEPEMAYNAMRLHVLDAGNVQEDRIEA